MSIRNDELGGTDWGNEELTSQDLNDTFDAAVNKIQTLSAFWLNDEIYSVYDDFESYSLGSFATQGNWTINLVPSAYTATSNIVSSTLAGGTSQELRLYLARPDTASYTTQSAEAIVDLDNNKHTMFRCYMSVYRRDAGAGTIGAGAVISIGNSTDGWTTIKSIGAVSEQTITDKPAIMVIAKGSDVYDVYLNYDKVVSDVTLTNGLQLRFYEAFGSIRYTQLDYYIYVDDIRQSKTAIF